MKEQHGHAVARRRGTRTPMGDSSRHRAEGLSMGSLPEAMAKIVQRIRAIAELREAHLKVKRMAYVYYPAQPEQEGEQ
jgi:hypothetical protein